MVFKNNLSAALDDEYRLGHETWTAFIQWLRTYSPTDAAKLKSFADLESFLQPGTPVKYQSTILDLWRKWRSC